MALEFDIRKYNPEGNNLVDGSDALANQRDQVISFQNIRNEESVFFKAFITAFSDTYSPNFNGVEVFGRTDAIQQYKGTSRSITLAFKVPAASESEAFENLGRAGKLIQMLYPSYASVSNALTLSEAPLVRLKVMNLLSKKQGEALAPSETFPQFYSKYKSTAEPNQGILGAITSCTINHGLESEGAFSKIDREGEQSIAVPNTILPKLIEINVSFTPIHEETIGFEGEANNTPSFPYGVFLKPPLNPASQGTPPSEKNKLNEDLETKRQAAASAQQAEDLAKAKLEKAANKMNRMYITKKQQKRRFDARQQAQSEYDAAATASESADRDLARTQSEFDFL
jgi:hypothetical protein